MGEAGRAIVGQEGLWSGGLERVDGCVGERMERVEWKALGPADRWREGGMAWLLLSPRDAGGARSRAGCLVFTFVDYFTT